MSGFPDHFSAVAADYASHRPSYPAALFDWLAEQAPARRLAWDCATGSGQAARDLAGRLDRVNATDAAAAQIDAAWTTTRAVSWPQHLRVGLHA